MNYYIQGNKEKADQIKAAFERLGFDVTGFDMRNDNILFFTYKLQAGANVISTTNAHLYTANIIKTHPDYKELELPVEPKFKKGDWIACDADSFTLSIKSVKDGNYFFHQGVSLPIKDIDEHYHLWTIADSKDGDVLVDSYSKDSLIILYKGINKEQSILAHCGWNGYNFSIKTNGLGYGGLDNTNYLPATKEQRDLLFAKMREAGYKWDADKKELRKIKPHYDIKNFKPFQKVLCRGHNRQAWRPSLYGFYDTTGKYPMFVCATANYLQCIPFEGNEHLLGTTDMPDEMYINW